MACTLATLAPTGGSPVLITITGTLAAGSAGQSIADAATVGSNTADPDLTNNTATFNQLVGPVADVAIAKAAFLSDGMTPVTNPLQVGNTFIYRLTITNNGPSRRDRGHGDRPAADRHHARDPVAGRLRGHDDRYVLARHDRRPGATRRRST